MCRHGPSLVLRSRMPWQAQPIEIPVLLGLEMVRIPTADTNPSPRIAVLSNENLRVLGPGRPTVGFKSRQTSLLLQAPHGLADPWRTPSPRCQKSWWKTVPQRAPSLTPTSRGRHLSSCLGRTAWHPA